MKSIFRYLIIIALLGTVSCKENTKQTPSIDNAALKLYYQYADNENLTVAYLGDFSLDGNKIDALMIQANEEEDWSQLKAEFGMSPNRDSIIHEDCDLAAPQENQKVISIGVGLDTDFLKELGLDTITDLSQVDEERFNEMTKIIAEKISDIINNFPMPDTTLPTNATIVGDGPVKGLDDTSITMEEYLNTLSQAIGTAMLNEMIAKNSGIATEEGDNLDGKLYADSTSIDPSDYGHSGYVSAADAANRTIWLFFYDDQKECNNILNHIKDDIIVGQSDTETN